MPSLSPAALDFVAHLVRAHDPASLYQAFEHGLVPLFRNHFISATFHLTKGRAFTSFWRSVPARVPSPEYMARNNALNPGFGYVRERPGIAVCTVSDVMPETEIERHPYYREFMKPEGWRYGLAIMVWHRGEVVGLIAIARSPEHGDFTAHERALATTLHPFLVAAWARIAADTRDDDARLAQEGLLSTLPLAALVYSARDGRVLFHNRAAKDAIARWRGEAARKRPRAVTARWLPAEIVAACEEVPARGATVHSPRGGMRASLRRMDARAHFDSGVVLIVLDDDDRDAAKPSAAWTRIERELSAAERQVAREAARGRSNAEIGRTLGKSGATVKKQLESVFAKARVRGRGALAALYSGLR